ncbi:MAG: hypothetical protein ABI243_13650 [Lapillicoccus sp.]
MAETKPAGVYVVAGGPEEEEDGPVRSDDPTSGSVVVTDRGHAPAPEFLGGFAIVEVPDDGAATAWACRVAQA